MNRENIQKWVDALRSGQFQQGGKSLKPSATEHCCLGVLCDISGLGQWAREVGGFRLEYRAEGYESSAIPPVPVVEWLGITENDRLMEIPNVVLDEKASFLMKQHFAEGGIDDEDPPQLEPGDRWGVAGLNDSGRFSFEDIADLIEATYL